MSGLGLSPEEARKRQTTHEQQNFGPFGVTAQMQPGGSRRISSYEELLDFRQGGRTVVGDPGESADPNFVPGGLRTDAQNQKAVDVGASRRAAGGTITSGTDQLTNPGAAPATAPAASPTAPGAAPTPSSVTKVGGGLMGVIQDKLKNSTGSLFKAASTTLLGG